MSDTFGTNESFGVRLIAVTKPVLPEFEDAEALVAYCARVSSPNQENPDYAGLLRYCAEHSHWSVFTMANMVVEVETSRAISQQILRHWTFDFQEFSQRYAAATEAIVYPARRQDNANRQNSIDDLPEDVNNWFMATQSLYIDAAFNVYQQALDKGIAKEQARFLLPLSTKTKLYMNGNLRTWIHYLSLRADPEHGTQVEHREIAQAIKEIFIEEFPTIARALEWT